MMLGSTICVVREQNLCCWGAAFVLLESSICVVGEQNLCCWGAVSVLLGNSLCVFREQHPCCYVIASELLRFSMCVLGCFSRIIIILLQILYCCVRNCGCYVQTTYITIVMVIL